jgi:transposase InsO family protein
MRAAGKAPQQLSAAIFEWIEAWYNPRRRHTSAGYLAPADYQRRHTTAATAT